jgi:hypothetical protein
MENIKSENRIFGSYKPRSALMLIFSIAILICTLAPAFFQVPIFCGIAFFTAAALIFMTARDIIPVCGILLPAMLELMATGSLSLPSVYVSVIFTIAATAYVTLVGRWYFAFGAAVIAYACGAYLLDPITALIAPAGVLIGFLFSLMLTRCGIGATAGISAALISAGGVAIFLALGGDLSSVGESARTYITDLYMSINEINAEIFFIEESTAEMLAAYFVNISPALIFAVVSAVCYIAASLTVSFLNSSGLGDEIPEEMRTLHLSPVNGFVFIACFFLSAAFSLEGGKFEMWAAVCDNIVIALVFPFTALGTQTAYDFFIKKIFASIPARRKVSGAAIALIFIIVPSIALAFFMSLGTAKSLMPFYSALAKKIKSQINR